MNTLNLSGWPFAGGELQKSGVSPHRRLRASWIIFKSVSSSPGFLHLKRSGFLHHSWSPAHINSLPTWHLYCLITAQDKLELHGTPCQAPGSSSALMYWYFPDSCSASLIWAHFDIFVKKHPRGRKFPLFPKIFGTPLFLFSIFWHQIRPAVGAKLKKLENANANSVILPTWLNVCHFVQKSISAP